jgi:hypothetical protein
MIDKPAPRPADDTYSDEEAAKRRDATIRAMIGMKPKPRTVPSKKKKGRAPTSRVR